MQSVFHSVLVVGDNPKEIADKYSLSVKSEKHIKMKRSDAKKMLNRHIKVIKALLDDNSVKLPESHKDYFKELYLSLKDMDDFDYFLEQTKGCIYDEETGDAYTFENPNAKYKMYNIENLHFAEPFILKDGSSSFSAKKSEIDWDEMHMNRNKTKLCERVWDLIVENVEPMDEKEKEIVKNWSPRSQYFLNFSTKEEYVRHTCSFWHYGVASYDKYEEITYEISDKDWVSGFYDKYIKDLPEDTLLTVIEVRSMD